MFVEEKGWKQLILQKHTEQSYPSPSLQMKTAAIPHQASRVLFGGGRDLFNDSNNPD
jgi:hypothetical protein